MPVFMPKELRKLFEDNLPKVMEMFNNGIKKLDIQDELKGLYKELFPSENSASVYAEYLKKTANIDPDKFDAKKVIFNFFGMNKTWPIWRNLAGGLMVHSPEYPTYFIPAYTQAKASGEAKDLKKGEGPRGLITGGLEGVAVGALVSGRHLHWKQMGPYILLGAGLQYFSSKFFPWLGEKMGREIYFRNIEKKGLIISKEQLKELKALKAKSEKHGKVKTAKGIKKPNENNTTINPKPAYPKSGGMKI